MENTEIKPSVSESTTGSPYRYAGFWIRFVAALIDGILVAVATMLVQTMTGENEAIATLISAGYHIGFWVKNDGTTLGKKVVGIKVIQTNGQPMDIKAGILRYVGYIISSLAIGIGFIWVAFDKKKQGWHDKIASTYVVYK